jgi:hypothetical protein
MNSNAAGGPTTFDHVVVGAGPAGCVLAGIVALFSALLIGLTWIDRQARPPVIATEPNDTPADR